MRRKDRTRRRRSRAGFSLVEVAIVLVVIGLLLGTVLQGRALIGNAEYRSLKSDLEAYQAAYQSFRERYGAVPGDMPADAAERRLEAGLNVGGDGDGVIDDGPGCTDAGDEACIAWQHLRAAGLISGNPEAAGDTARPSHPYPGHFDSLFTGAEGNGRFANKLLITGVPGDVAQQLDADIDDDRHDRGRLSCVSGCEEANGYPGGDTLVDLAFSL